MANNARPRPQSGAGYLFQGFSLMMAPGLRRFVIIPILINVLLLGGAFIYLLSQVGDWIDHWMASLPEWLSWLSFLIWPLVVVAILVVFSYVFSTLANWIAAPFNGLLAEHVEAKLSGTRAPDDGLACIIKDIPRVMKREWQKLAYYIPRAIGFLLLLWIPAVGQTVGPVIWFLFSAWMMAIQYCDYPFDNHKVSFPAMRQTLNQQRGASLGFGAVVMLFTMTPFLNLLVMPAAVCGATAMWVDKHKASLGRN